MEVKNAKVMFCHCCSNVNLNGDCMYNKEKECGITQTKLDKIFSPIVKKLKKCGELPYNFKKFHITTL